MKHRNIEPETIISDSIDTKKDITDNRIVPVVSVIKSNHIRKVVVAKVLLIDLKKRVVGAKNKSKFFNNNTFRLSNVMQPISNRGLIG